MPDFFLFWTIFWSERAVSTIFPPYIMTNGTSERNYDDDGGNSNEERFLALKVMLLTESESECNKSEIELK